MRFFVFMVCIVAINPVFAGKIVVNRDEWTLSNTGINNSPNGSLLAQNFASYFTGGGSDSVFGHSTNFSSTQSSLSSALTNAGHSYASGTNISFDLATLLAYDKIFLAGNTPGIDITILINYVKSGGNVYLAGGTDQGFNGATEAAFWNQFLNAFDLGFAPAYNGLLGNVTLPNQPHSIFNGINRLYFASGNSVTQPRAVATTYFNGLFGIYINNAVTSVPEPSTLMLSLLGLLIFCFQRRLFPDLAY